jgi:hypothetical protein
MRRRIVTVALFVAGILPACAVDLEPSGAGRACSLGRCSPGYVCNAESRCMAAAQADSSAGGATTAESGGATTERAGGPGSGGASIAGGRPGAGGAASGAGGASAGTGATPNAADAGAPGGAGNTTMPMDASTDAARDAGCPQSTRYYRDRDGDGFGDDGEARSFCAVPPGWAREGGDCNDADDRVFPGQTKYFGAGYTVQGGQSFDYDCSGGEEPDPGAAAAAPDCPALALLVCAGTGFARTGRQGRGIDPTCGSTAMVTCSGLLACTATTAMVAPKGCR